MRSRKGSGEEVVRRGLEVHAEVRALGVERVFAAARERHWERDEGEWEREEGTARAKEQAKAKNHSVRVSLARGAGL